jgi:hypothetical protein
MKKGNPKRIKTRKEPNENKGEERNNTHNFQNMTF